MRPGYLGDAQDYWFGNLDGEYFEILEERSANPIYVIRDRVRGKTAEEFKAFIGRGGWSSTLIPKVDIINRYKFYPYKNENFPNKWKLFQQKYKEKNKIFKLVR